jgi:hypothetical protein
MDSTGSISLPESGLLSVLANGSRTEALSLLHHLVVQRAGGSCSLLFESHPGSASLHATSGHGLDALPTTPWDPSPSEAAALAGCFAGGRPVAFERLDEVAPSLAERLGTGTGVIVPLATRVERMGLVAIGVPSGVQPDLTALESSDVGRGFLLALELARLRQREELEHEIRTLLDGFADRLAATLDFALAIEPLCEEVSRLFGADRMNVWLHDREARQLVLHASSNYGPISGPPAVRADDPISPAAAALRSARAGLGRATDSATSLLTVPLRGCRRALGTLVFEGVRIEPGDDITLLMRADELGRQLSSALETLQLLQTVRRTARND